MNMHVFNAAMQLRRAIEMTDDGLIIAQSADELARSLGGNLSLAAMSPGTAAIYLIALLLSQPPEGM